MSLGKTWFKIDEAIAKFGVSEETLLGWIEEGLVRTEEGAEDVTLVNADDILLQEGSLGAGDED